MNFREIWEGWRNDAIPEKDLSSAIREMAADRLIICRRCNSNSKVRPISQQSLLDKLRLDEHCLECGCPLSKATKSPKKECPLGKWPAYIKEEESDEKLVSVVDKIEE